MQAPTLSYTPTRRGLWLRVLVREFLVPRPRWGRLLVGPQLMAVGGILIALGSMWESSALGLVGGALVGIGVGWMSWPLAGAWLAVTRAGAVRRRVAVTLVLTNGAIELQRGEDRRLFPLEDLERIDTIGGEHWLRFRGERAVMVPNRVAQGEPGAFVAAVRSQRALLTAVEDDREEVTKTLRARPSPA